MKKKIYLAPEIREHKLKVRQSMLTGSFSFTGGTESAQEGQLDSNASEGFGSEEGEW